MNEQSEFMKKWEAAKKRAAELATGTEVPEAVKEITIQPVEQVVKKEVKNYTVKKKYYNIHKRSLPPGIDKIVYFNVELETANMVCDKFLISKSYTDVSRNTKTLIYYDIIPVNAVPREKNIYYNPEERVKPVEQNVSEGETQWIS